jgi:hypothetical protein
MRTRPSFLSVLGAVMLGAVAAWAQDTPTPTPPASANVSAPLATTPDAPPLKSEEIDALVAPIALYPDTLLAQMLIASTYPGCRTPIWKVSSLTWRSRRRPGMQA